MSWEFITGTGKAKSGGRVLNSTPSLHVVDFGTLSATTTKVLKLPGVNKKVSAVKIQAGASQSASISNYFAVEVLNKGTAGSGSTKIVDDTVAANNTKAGLTAYTPYALTIAGSNANLAVADDSLQIKLTVTGTVSLANTQILVYLVDRG